MSGQILVPLDGSAFGEQALPLAMAVARRNGATIQLVKVHCPPPPPPRGSVLFDADIDVEIREIEESYLHSVANSIRAQGIPVRTAVLNGEVAPALEAFLESRDVSMVAMTTHGRGGLSRAWFGSVADALVRRVEIPVLMTRPQSPAARPRAFEAGFHHILIPLDGSALSEQAIPQALQLGRLFDARYTLLQVVAPPFGVPADAIVAPLADYEAETEQLRVDALEYLNGVAAPLREQGLQVDTTVVIQLQAAASILEEASVQRADLIVMCTHGRGGWRRFALGSIADKVLRGAQVPVLMFRARLGVEQAHSATTAREAFV